MIKVAIIAGEPSGDLLASGLISELKKQTHNNIKFMGIGGNLMAREGFVSSYDMQSLSVMGIFEIIKHLPKILIIRAKIIKKIIEFKPDVFIGIDLPDFNFYVEKSLKKHGIKTVHYISPTIWAWRYERIHKIKTSTDLMLCAFPMEEVLYKNEGIKAKFVGHILADNIEQDIDTESYKRKLELKDKVFTILVGSRVGEIKSLAKIFIESCNIINADIENSIFLFPFANQETCNLFNKFLQSSIIKFKYKLLLNQTSDAIKASDMVLAKSGTVTLMVALCKKPLIISYKISKLTEWIVRRKIKIKYAGLPNILLNEPIVDEVLQNDANAKNLAIHFIKLYHDKNRQKYMISKFDQLHNLLKHNASFEAAKAILNLLER